MTNIKINNLTPDWEPTKIDTTDEHDTQQDPQKPNPKLMKQKKEDIVIDAAFNLDIKVVVLFIALLCSVFLLIGFVMTDRGLQNGLDTIKENKKENVVSERIIQKETRLIEERLKANDKVREEMKKNYNVIIN